MTFLTGLLAALGEKLIEAGLVVVEGWIGQLTARLRQETTDQKNLDAFQAAKASKDQAAIDQAAQNLLNGVNQNG